MTRILPIKILSAEESAQVSAHDLELAKITTQINAGLAIGTRQFGPIPMAFGPDIDALLGSNYNMIRAEFFPDGSRVAHYVYTLDPVRRDLVRA